MAKGRGSRNEKAKVGAKANYKNVWHCLQRSTHSKTEGFQRHVWDNFCLADHNEKLIDDDAALHDFDIFIHHSKQSKRESRRVLRRVKSFWKYYSGQEVVAVLTIFIGGNHEASNYLWELSSKEFMEASQLLEKLKPSNRFSAHLHCKFTALVEHEEGG
ncbi:hypothetical protein GOBAR_DD28356 [Gossypium barbadense]|nr:hypothetical protein GOBAR_DD28356 [Gossypium barbadense]